MKMADFEKFRTGHERQRWTAQCMPAIRVRAHDCTLADVGTGQSRAGLVRGP